MRRSTTCARSSARACRAPSSRPALAASLRRFRRGDTLVVVELDRLARSLEPLLEMVRGPEARWAYLRVLGDPIDTATPQGRFMLQLPGPRARAGAAAIRPWWRGTQTRSAASGTPARTPTSPGSPPAPMLGCR